MSDAGIERLARLLESLAQEARELGHALTFHGHVGTYVETPDELDRLMAAADPDLVGCCLDVGHYLLGGGDPVQALRAYGERVRHVHLKDVDPRVAERMRSGELTGSSKVCGHASSPRSAPVARVQASSAALAERDYRGWIVVEQDTTWRPPSESAAISRAIIDYVAPRARRRTRKERQLTGGRATRSRPGGLHEDRAARRRPISVRCTAACSPPSPTSRSWCMTWTQRRATDLAASTHGTVAASADDALGRRTPR